MQRPAGRTALAEPVLEDTEHHEDLLDAVSRDTSWRGARRTGWVYGHELVHPDGEKTMLLYALGVPERARRRGVGKTLVTAFVDHARGRGCTEVWVLTDDANAAGIATYSAAEGTRDSVPQVMFTWKLAEGRHS